MPEVRNAVVVLLDSLNCHLVGAYGGAEFATPNIDRLAARAVRFDRHYAGSLPCMPARHDILCGALDFLWRPWGSIELWERPITEHLRAAGVVTMLVSDHPHLFETGGENYHCDFGAWEYQRGHEGDLWKTRPDPSWMGAPSFGRGHMPYDDSRGWFEGEADFPGPRTLSTAARWLEQHAPHHDRFLLFVDEFDPHEPFDTPEPYASMYDPEWQGPHLIWPPYTNGAVARGVMTDREGRQVRASYGAKLTMIDAWLGRMLDVLDRTDRWSDTAVILCTDHGHFLGEKDIWGKPAVPVYEPLGHIPLLIAWPGIAPGRRDTLTTSVDLHATLVELFGVEQRAATTVTHGRSLVPLLTGATSSVREHALCGVWGREVHLVADATKYVRAPVGENAPLSMWSNRWSTMPVHGHPELRLPAPDDRAVLDRMPGSTIPVIRQPFSAGDAVPFWALARFDGHHLFDVDEDPREERDLVGGAGERAMIDRLVAALEDVDAPSDQFVRLGLGSS
ncbi:MAG TPA: sulfatase [Acidimicrobiales bacterium]|jgi:arylsulfatase A-like enzyme|nr:sulfatase [Acidimicrobiales bacterium]